MNTPEMTDRELLELAAKAAGMTDAYWSPLDDGICVPAGEYEGEPTHTFWNPLTDDGDALRLAVKLRMNIVVTTHGPSARCEAAPSKWADENCAAGSDYEAAARRAIVRAAAAIAKDHPHD